MRRMQFEKWSPYLYAIVSGVLIFLSAPDYNYYVLAWFGFLPLFMAIQEKPLFQSYVLGLITGIVVCIGSVPWILNLSKNFMNLDPPFHILGLLTYSFYSGQVFGISIFLYRAIQTYTSIPTVIHFPITATAIWSLFPLLFPLDLGLTQSYFLVAVQAIEFTGLFGLNWMLFLVNIVLYEILQNQKLISKPMMFNYFLIALWFSYGFYSMKIWENKIEIWGLKNIGIIQPNRPATLGEKKPDTGYSKYFPWEMEISLKLAKQGLDLIVWPEGHLYKYGFDKNVQTSFEMYIKEMQVPILFQDSTFTQNNGMRYYHNSAIFIDLNGIEQGRYHKNILVPFGEQTPFYEYLNWFEDIAGLDFSNLTPGKNQILFHLNGMFITPLICYEINFPLYVADFVDINSKGNIIIAGSQDGWYSSYQNVEQHTALLVMRAIENRVPAIHAVYNGFSSIILPNGKMIQKTPYFERGAWKLKIPFSKQSGGSFFTQFPSLFIYFIRILSFLFVFWMLFKMRKSNKNRSRYKIF